MHKALIVGIAAVLIAQSSPVRAQQPQDDARSQHRPSPPPTRTMGAEVRLADRLAYLRETLRLAPEQDKNWSAYESALQSLSNTYREGITARPDQSRAVDPTQRLRERAERMSRLSAALARVADAQEPLYNSLDEAQKLRFAELSTASLDDLPGPRRDEHERYRRSDRDDDLYRGRGRRDREYDRRDDREYDRDRRYGRDYDGDRDRRERDYRRNGWRDRDYDRRDGYDSRRRYGRDYDRDREWRGGDDRRRGRDWGDHRERGYERGQPDEDYRL